MKYLTRDNITLALSIIGSTGTVIAWLVSYIRSKKNLSVKIVRLSNISGLLVIYAMISNKSRLPISIESLSVEIENEVFMCELLPKKLFEKTRRSGNEIKEHKSYYTLQLPVHLPPLGSASGYFCFDIPEEVSQNLSTPLTILVYTNRGKSLEKKLPFGKVSSLKEML